MMDPFKIPLACFVVSGDSGLVQNRPIALRCLKHPGERKYLTRERRGRLSGPGVLTLSNDWVCGKIFKSRSGLWKAVDR